MFQLCLVAWETFVLIWQLSKQHEITLASLAEGPGKKDNSVIVGETKHLPASRKSDNSMCKQKTQEHV